MGLTLALAECAVVVDEVPTARSLSSGCSSAKGCSTHKSCLTARSHAESGGHVDLASVIHSDGWPGYDGLVDIGFNKHFLVNHGANELRLMNVTSTALKASGAMQTEEWPSSTA